ncbi:hypothetical protein HY546_00505 [archaeon]|nr:hypothetical protein [archaeon]
MKKEDGRPIRVMFADDRLKAAFEKISRVSFEDRSLNKLLTRAFDDLKGNPFVGIKIPKRLWPKDYIQKFQVNNVWKYDLPNAWRLIYTIKGTSVEIIAVLLEWFDHKNYERRFNY